MPELPEVETVRRTLAPYVTGRTITAVTVLWEGALVGMSTTELQAHLVGARICSTARRGKYLGLVLEDRGFLVVHLRMTGRLMIRQPDAPKETHLRWWLTLDDASELHFVDQRKFGKVYWANNAAEYAAIAHVGPEPLSDEFTPATLAATLTGSKSNIKACLLDQERVAGLGNIYADESLFRARIHPARTAGSLSGSEIALLWSSIRAALQSGIDHGGTTLRDYVDGNGRQGDNQNFLLVYGKAGEPCPNCGTVLVRTKIAGRGTVFCPECQK